MKIKFNPIGTHIRKGKLFIRLDFYPDPSSKTYVLQYVDVFARELTEEESERDENGVLTEKAKELQKVVPIKKQLNPFLCHFIAIDPDMTKGELTSYIRTIFTKNTLTKLDDILCVDNRKNELCPTLKGKFGNGRVNVEADKVNLEEIKSRFSGLEEVI
ncbi:hypothetical protein ES705_30697 [subsurface metagenome]